METGFKGTKGEWVVKHSDSNNSWNVIGANLGAKYKIARCPYICTFEKRDMVEAKANAQLIAAAPLMLDALVRIKAELLRCDMLDEKTERFINATVAKATGGQS